MSWLEIIRVRGPAQSAAAAQQRLEQLLDHLAERHDPTPRPLRVTLYAHLVLEGFFAIHLLWAAAPRLEKSDVAHLLCEHCGGFAMVDYSAWSEPR